MPVRVLSVASEAVPLIKTGGLADVVGALPAALAPHGVELSTLLPAYPQVLAKIGKGARTLHRYDSLLGEPARILSAKSGASLLLLLDAPGLYAREGGPYADARGIDWADNWRRFAALGRAAADLAGGIVPGHGFDLVHAHDWQAAMAAAYLRFASPHPVPSMVTIHNIAFQGVFGPEIFPRLALPDRAWSIAGVEYHGGVSFLKGGLTAADAITTVSPTYAEEIRTRQYGMGLEGLIVAREPQVHGIVNGIDHAEWNPATDPAIASRFTAADIGARTANKRALEADFSLDVADGPLFVVISRLTWQKGIDVLAEVIDHLVGIGGRLAVLGAGEPALETELTKAAARHPGKMGLRLGYDEALAHRMQAGGDAILIPSRFEPCGLTQLYGLAYGCVPVVARTGGLADTVIDANLAAQAAGVATGIQFGPVDYANLARATTHATALYADAAAWRAVQCAGMGSDFSWARSGRAYAELYRRLLKGA